MSRPTFTQEQKDWICYQIGEWYLTWKDRLVDYEDKTHRLGDAKEILKIMICDSEEEIMKRLTVLAAKISTKIKENLIE